MDDRPVFFLWLKYQYHWLKWIPFGWGDKIWSWADDKVTLWHRRHGRQ
jgi:hypothetical protein